MPSTKTKPRQVDFLNQPQDLKAAVLAHLGFSTAFICAKTQLTPCQVSYRLRKVGVKRSDYRDGTSAFAGLAFTAVSALAANQVRAWAASQNGHAKKE